MKQSHFFAHLSRLKLINRWPLMRNVRTENVSEHSLQVAMVAHALAAIKNRKFAGQVNVERIALLALYHDASEVLTGDLPTPVKYFNSQIAQEYKAIEKIAQQKLVDMVPDELRDIFAPLIDEQTWSDEEKAIVKQADALCAYLKCLEELSAGNNEFLLAKTRLEKTLAARRSAEMDYFMAVFVPSFHLSLEEISQDSPLELPDAAARTGPARCGRPTRHRRQSEREQHRDHHHAYRHHNQGKRHAQLNKIAEAVISRP